MKTLEKHSIKLVFLTIGLICIFFSATSFTSSKALDERPATHIVVIKNMKFNPEHLTIKKGDVVKWINEDIVPHDVTEINKKWASKPLKPGDSFTKAITKDLKYFCSIHVVMKGSITVSDK
jgi:plastocyanin